MISRIKNNIPFKKVKTLCAVYLLFFGTLLVIFRFANNFTTYNEANGYPTIVLWSSTEKLSQSIYCGSMKCNFVSRTMAHPADKVYVINNVMKGSESGKCYNFGLVA